MFRAHVAIKKIVFADTDGVVLQGNADATDEALSCRLLASSHLLTLINFNGGGLLCPLLFMETIMLKYAIIFALISLVAGALGFGGVAAGSAGIAKILFGLFLILAVVFIVLAALGVGAVKKALD